jgi:hypothetical protein
MRFQALVADGRHSIISFVYEVRFLKGFDDIAGG